ncbi:MAG: carboxymuconolactone decarboxylase family protein [Candidatus Acidiferrales bacterium]
MQALADYETSAQFTPNEKLVLRYADRMTETPVEVTDELFNELKAKFTPAQLVELTSAIAWENYRARFNHAVGAESEGFSEPEYCAISAGREMLHSAGEGPDCPPWDDSAAERQ